MRTIGKEIAKRLGNALNRGRQQIPARVGTILNPP